MLSILWRTIRMYVAIAVPGCLIAAALAGNVGAIAWAVLSALGLTLASVLSERILARAHGAVWTIPPGLSKTLECACAVSALPIPKLGIFPSATPTALALRGLGGKGTVLVSQGLIALLPEQELRAVLHRCAAQAISPGLSLRTLASLLAFGAFRTAPRAWSELFYSDQPLGAALSRDLKPLQALGFVMTYPPLSLLLRLTQPFRSKPAARTELDDFFLQAVRLIQRHLLRPDSSEHGLSVRPLCVISN